MTRKQKLGTKLLMVALGAILILSSFTGCFAEKETIKFADQAYDSAMLGARVAGFITEHGYGYEPEYVAAAESTVIIIGLVSGDIHVQLDCWSENYAEALFDRVDAGEIVILGTNYDDNWQGWLVPTYVIKGDPERGIEPMAPDLKSVFDLPDYWELFKDPEDPTKGRFINSIPGWLCTGFNSEKLVTYGLDEYYTDFITGSDAALSASMVAAYEKGEPWLGYYWEPTWQLGKLDMTRLEEPPFDPEIWETTRGCTFMANNVLVTANPDFVEKYPEVAEFLRHFSINTATQNKILAYMDDNEASYEEAAIWYLEEYESIWTQWVDADIASKVKAALP